MKTRTNELQAILPRNAFDFQGQLKTAEKLLATVSPERRAEVSSAVENDMAWSREYTKQYLSMRYNQRQPLLVRPDGVAVVHIKGYLSRDLTFFEKCMESSDYEDIKADLIAAELNPLVKAILIWIDSPGGGVIGTLEVATIIANLKKPNAVFGQLIGSAAYYLAAGADAIYVPESGFVGSIGIISTITVFARMLEKDGIDSYIITSPGADQKAAGNSVRTPTAAELEDLNATAAEYGDQFVGHVLKHRPQVSKEVLRGNAVSGRQAVGFGLTDGIASFEGVVDELLALAA